MDYSNYQSPFGYNNGMQYNQQKPPGPPAQPQSKTTVYGGNHWSNYGYPANAPVMPMNYGGYWATPAPGNMQGGTFPKKTRPGAGFNGRGNKRPHPQMSKTVDTTGKTPAMLLHELFKDFTEKYNEVVENNVKRYKCILTVSNQEFSNEGISKKAAKQKTAEEILRALRPDITFTPYDDGSSAAAAAQPPLPPHPYANFVQNTMEDGYAHPTPSPAKKSGPPSKKAKVVVPAVDSALSVVDALRKLCIERFETGPYNPVFEYQEINESETTEKYKKKYMCILSFPEKNIKFCAEGIGRTAPKDSVCLQALKEIFEVTEAQIRSIMKRNVMGKGTEIPIVQNTHRLCSLLYPHCTIAFKIDAVEPSIGIGTGKQNGFICELTLTDTIQKKNVLTITNSSAPSKHEAKEEVCRQLLKQHFDIDPDNMVTQTQAAPPCQQLQVLCAKKYKKNDNVRFEDLGTVGVRDQNSYGFKFKCIVEGKEFIGIGQTKKEAKNNAASEALRVLFEDNVPEISEECHELTTFAMREHFNLCQFYGIIEDPSKASTFFATFIFINSRGAKRIGGLASSAPGFNTGPYCLDSNGTVLHHMDPIVLARRALVRYLIKEMKIYMKEHTSYILEQGPDGLFKMRDDVKLVMYATFPPAIHSSENGRLTLTGSGTNEPVGPNGQTTEDIKKTKILKTHAIADKIFKWTHLGLQGALLTTVMHPILLDKIYFGSCSHNGFQDSDYRQSFFDRINLATRDVHVEQTRKVVKPFIDHSYIYCKPDAEVNGCVEFLDYTGKTTDQKPSIICKASIYEEFLDVNPSIPRDTPYQSAKALATLYNHSKQILYDQLSEKGYGIWHQRPEELSNFILPEEPLNPKEEIDFSLDS